MIAARLADLEVCGTPADTLPGQDSNLENQNQNLVCYRLHHRVNDTSLSEDRIRENRVGAAYVRLTEA